MVKIEFVAVSPCLEDLTHVTVTKMGCAKGATQRKIAEIAGVSMATVSRCLRGDPSQLPKTIHRIQKIARDLGYKFDPLLSQNMSLVRRQRVSSQRGTLAYISADLNRRELDNNLEYLKGARKRAKAYSYKVEHIWFDRKTMSPKRFDEILEARGIKGILFAPLHYITQSIDISWGRFPSVVYGFALETPALHRTTDDHTQGMRLALKMLRAKGYRRIGYVTEERMEFQARRLWMSAYCYDLQTRPIKERVPALQIGMRSINQMKSWYQKYKPEAVITAGIANQFFLALHKKNKGKPIFATLEAKPKEIPEASGIRQRGEQVGAIGVDIVMQQILHNQFGIPKYPRVTLTQPIWHEGETTPSC